MNTPRKTFNYSSPYAKPVQKYPSQSEDYISLDMGGAMQHNPASSSEKTPAANNLKYYQQNYGNSNSKANRRNLFNNNYGQQNRRQSFQQQKRYTPRSSNENLQQSQNIRNSHEKRQSEQQYNHNDKKGASIADYCHSSMTEDPWVTLIQRIKALEKSKISVEETSSSPLDANSSNDNEPEVDSD